jgi:hypothetical protein
MAADNPMDDAIAGAAKGMAMDAATATIVFRLLLIFNLL